MHQASTRILILPGLRRTNNFGHLRSIALGCKSGPTSLTCLSGLPTDVKHGFRASSASFSSLSGPEEPVGTSDFAKRSPVRLWDKYAIGVRIPSLTLTQSKEPSSTCILRPSTHSMIENTPGFYTPLPQLSPTDVVSTKITPNMGLGLFAKRGVEANEVIFAERPLLVFPRALRLRTPKNLSKEDEIKQHRSAFEEVLQQALSGMPKEDVDALMSLSNSLPSSPPLHGIVRTNTFGAGPNIGGENLQEGKIAYCVVGRLASRINHSCSPNVHMRFDIPTFSLQIVALRDIEANQQLFHCYSKLNLSVKDRQRQLATYGFECQCKACVNATPASDKLREEMDDRIQKIVEEFLAKSKSRPSIGSLDSLLKLHKEIVEEGLDFGPNFDSLFCIIFQTYGKLGVPPKKGGR